jgi:2-keto-4-pentenoate hydratase
MEPRVKNPRNAAFSAFVMVAALAAGCCPTCQQSLAISRHCLAARVTGAQVAPPSAAIGPASLNVAYLSQDYLIKDIVAGGDKVAGYKVAFTSAASRQAFGAPGPAYGRLLAGQRRDSGAAVPGDDFHKLAVELEVAMVIGRRIDRHVGSIEELRPCVRAVCPALELPDEHFAPEAGRATFEDRVADNLGAHRFVLGPAVEPDKVNVDAVAATLTHDGQAVANGRARDVLGSPWASLLWLVNGLVKSGFKLEPGDVVITGSMNAPYSPPPGREAGEYVGDFGTLGKVTCVIGAGTKPTAPAAQ